MEVEECQAAHHWKTPKQTTLTVGAVAAALFATIVIVEEASAGEASAQESPAAAAAVGSPQEEDNQLQDLHQPHHHQLPIHIHGSNTASLGRVN